MPEANILRLATPYGVREYPINYVPTAATIGSAFKLDRLVKVRLYGRLARVAGRNLFELAVCSVRETINALHNLTAGRTSDYIARTNNTVRWRVLVNGQQLNGDDPTCADEMMIERALETIDIYPVPEGGGNFLGLIFGALLLIVGIILWFAAPAFLTIAVELMIAGVASLLGGLVGLMQSPQRTPKQKKTQNHPSYLFSGSVNTQDQGGPVPVAYGKVIIGSQTISAVIQNSVIIETNSPFGRRRAPVALLAPGPELSAWMTALKVTVYPTVIGQMTPQTPQLPGGPAWLIKYLDGSVGFSYDADPSVPLVRTGVGGPIVPQQTPLESNFNLWMSGYYITVMPTVVGFATAQNPQIPGGPFFAWLNFDNTVSITYENDPAGAQMNLGVPELGYPDPTYKLWLAQNKIMLMPTVPNQALLQIPYKTDASYPNFAFLNDDGSIGLAFGDLDPSTATPTQIVWPVATPGAATTASLDPAQFSLIQLNQNT